MPGAEEITSRPEFQIFLQASSEVGRTADPGVPLRQLYLHSKNKWVFSLGSNDLLGSHLVTPQGLQEASEQQPPSLTFRADLPEGFWILQSSLSSDLAFH